MVLGSFWQLLRPLLGVLIALGLIVAPIQAMGVSKASFTTEMSGEPCPKKPSCCEKPDPMQKCADAAGCFVKCGGATALENSELVSLPITLPVDFMALAVAISPFGPPPLRRPPRT